MLHIYIYIYDISNLRVNPSHAGAGLRDDRAERLHGALESGVSETKLKQAIYFASLALKVICIASD